jgi:hypothetical protein
MCGHRFESRWGHWVNPLLTLTLKPTYIHNAHPASPLQLCFLSLPAYSIHASIMYYVYSCIIYIKNTINQKEWHVATKRLDKHRYRRKTVVRGIADPDPHFLGSLIRIRIRTGAKNWIQIRNKFKLQELKMEPWGAVNAHN